MSMGSSYFPSSPCIYFKTFCILASVGSTSGNDPSRSSRKALSWNTCAPGSGFCSSAGSMLSLRASSSTRFSSSASASTSSAGASAAGCSAGFYAAAASASCFAFCSSMLIRIAMAISGSVSSLIPYSFKLPGMPPGPISSPWKTGV